MKNITPALVYVGTDDKTIDLFEGQYVVPHGISYNSYILFDEKIAVFDTADKRKTQEWLQNVETALGGKTPAYLIISHMEPDHSASIAAFLQKYPNAIAVGNDKTFTIASRFFGDAIQNKLTVKDGDELSLGGHTLKFVFAPMVHWPEVMFTYETTEKILFSADAFGKFGTLDTEEEWTDEARRYYLNIVGKYGNSVQAVLKKAATLDIQTICPLHGPMLTDNLGYYLEKYDVWSSYRAEEQGVLIAYASIYGNTAQAALKLAELLREKGVKVTVRDLARDDMAQTLSDAFRYDKLVLASVTYDAGLFPYTETFLTRLKSKNYQKRKVALIENGSWAPAAARLMRTKLEEMKDITFAQTTVTIPSAVHDETLSALSDLAKELSE
ncbi:MAG: FprA family A-type flavoprotein [Clostridiales bacterium]|nr:FprA family A-type flavoprotein [Clostridiales bacterium]